METVWNAICWVAFKVLLAGFITPFDWVIRAEIRKPTIPFGILRWCLTFFSIYLWWSITPADFAWEHAFQGAFLFGITGFPAILLRWVLFIIPAYLWMHTIQQYEDRKSRMLQCFFTIVFMLWCHFVIASYTMPA